MTTPPKRKHQNTRPNCTVSRSSQERAFLLNKRFGTSAGVEKIRFSSSKPYKSGVHLSRPASGSAVPHPPPPPAEYRGSSRPNTKGPLGAPERSRGPGPPSGNPLDPAPPSLPRAGRNFSRRHSRCSQEETGTLRTQGWPEQRRVARASPTAHAPRAEFPGPAPSTAGETPGQPGEPFRACPPRRVPPPPRLPCSSARPSSPPSASLSARPCGRSRACSAPCAPAPLVVRPLSPPPSACQPAWPGRPGGRRSPCVRALDFTSG